LIEDEDMSGIQDYSLTPANNTSINSIDISEGCPPSSINNAIRQEMADTRSFYESGGFVAWGHTCTYASGTSFTVAGNVTSVYVASRRLRAVGTGTGTIYGKVASSSYSSPNTTVTVTWDSGVLSNEALTVSVGWLSPTGTPISALLPSNNLSDVANAATARTNLGLAIGTNVQAYDADTAKTDVIQAWTAPQRADIETLTYSATTNIDFSLAQNYKITLTGNVSFTASNMTAEQSGFITITQDATGSRTGSWSTDFEFAGGTAPVLSTAANAVDTFPYYIRASGSVVVGAGAKAVA
jgi:hypothetical protein